MHFFAGATTGAIDLLPAPQRDQSEDWAGHLRTDDGPDNIFSFDGNSAAEIPNQRFNHTLSDHFTISAWLRHKESKDVLKKKDREQILCSSDGEGLLGDFFIHKNYMFFMQL